MTGRCGGNRSRGCCDRYRLYRRGGIGGLRDLRFRRRRRYDLRLESFSTRCSRNIFNFIQIIGDGNAEAGIDFDGISGASDNNAFDRQAGFQTNGFSPGRAGQQESGGEKYKNPIT